VPEGGANGLAIDAVGVIRIHPAPGGAIAALRGLDLRVSRGEIVAVVGPSGSGKSSLLRLLAGLDRPSAGRLTVLDTPIHTCSDRALARHRRSRIGVVEQHYRRSVSPYLSVLDAVGLPLALRGVGRRERQDRARELLTRVGLGDRLAATRTELSGGEQQRVAVATALSTRPELLLADEPTGELDRATAVELLELLARLVRDERLTAVIVTHDTLVEQIADRTVHVRDGRAVAERFAEGPAQRAVDAAGWLAPELEVLRDPPAPATGADPSAVAVLIEGASRIYESPSTGDGRRTRSRGLGLATTDARIPRGGFHVITGPSGVGKTTLLRLITGLDRPSTGRVVTLGQDLGELDRERLAALRAAHVGIVDQQRDLVPFLGARENVELGLAIRGRGGPASRSDGEAALERLSIAHLAERLPETLSAGERLRVSIARATATNPELLVLDEPTAALDRRAARQVAELLARLGGEGTTVVAATHDGELVGASSSRLELAPT
jgi:ABC-type lipoprotein export system ATPase subunit